MGRLSGDLGPKVQVVLDNDYNDDAVGGSSPARLRIENLQSEGDVMAIPTPYYNLGQNEDFDRRKTHEPHSLLRLSNSDKRDCDSPDFERK